MQKNMQSHNTGLLNYFELAKDGLYSTQRKISGEEITSKSVGLGIHEILPRIKKWVDGRDFKATCPWPELADNNKHLPEMCYCKEIYPCPNGDYILVLWKNDPSDSDGYRGLILDEKGNPSTYLNNSSSEMNSSVVWGHPCYYWIIPNKGLVVSVKFPDSKCDNDLFKKWIKNVVRTRLRIEGYNSRQSTENSTRISFSTPSTPESYGYIYKFETVIKEFLTSAEYLESIASQTKSVTIRNYVTTASSAGKKENKSEGIDAVNVDVFEVFSKFIGLFCKEISGEENEESSLSKRKVELMIEGAPSSEMVDELIAYNSEMADDDWTDIIFTTQDDCSVSFKSHRLIEKVTMDRTGDPYTGEELYKSLLGGRDNYLKRFPMASTMAFEDSTESLKIS